MMTTLDVFLNTELVGHLQLLPGERTLFTFAETYIANPQRSTLSQAFLNLQGKLATEVKPRQTKLPPFFSNLLPEGHLREYLAKQGGVKSEREFALLALLSADLPGAVVVKPGADNTSSLTEKITTSEIETESENILHFSLAGIQLKFSALLENQGGLTIPAHGVGGDWIVKLPSPRFPSVPENEYAMLDLARKIGIDVPEIKLIPLSQVRGLPDLGLLSGAQALAIKRFDRQTNGPHIHIEDFAQVYDVFPRDKYGKVSTTNLAQAIWTLTGKQGLEEFIRRLAFTIMIGNGDMHLKNWSLIYPDAQTAQLAPAYDFVSTIPYIPNDNLALTLVNTKDMTAVDHALFIKLAEKADLPQERVINTVTETVTRTYEIWQQEQHHYDLPPELSQRISAHMNSLALLL